jgi:hypothetical protein
VRPNVALCVSHLTTNSLSHQCPTHPAFIDRRAKLRSDQYALGSYITSHLQIFNLRRLDKLHSASTLLAGKVSNRRISCSIWSNIDLRTDGIETSEATVYGFYRFAFTITMGKLAVYDNFCVRVIPRWYCANIILMMHFTLFLDVGGSQKMGKPV